MARPTVILVVDTPETDLLRLTLQGGSGMVLDTLEAPIHGHVDNHLLTAVDILLKRNTMDRFALTAVLVGAGIDKNSSLCRIVTSFASAIAVTAAVGH